MEEGTIEKRKAERKKAERKDGMKECWREIRMEGSKNDGKKD